MLVLSRRLNEQIQIGDNITVSILRIKGNAVRIGIAAPRQVHIVRGELPRKPEPSGVSSTTSSSDASREPVPSRLDDGRAERDGELAENCLADISLDAPFGVAAFEPGTTTVGF